MKLDLKTMAKIMKGGDPMKMLLADMQQNGVVTWVFREGEGGRLLQNKYKNDIVKMFEELIQKYNKLSPQLAALEEERDELISEVKRLKKTQA